MLLIRLRSIIGLVLTLLLTGPAWSKPITFAVPDDFPTIQAAINAVGDGTVIKVGPGRYTENLFVYGKSISLVSKQGAKRTVIDGGGRGIVILIYGTGVEKVTISGFKLTNGFGDGGGGGVRVESASAVIEENIIEGNTACFGAGIFSQEAVIEVRRNLISNNMLNCAGNGGGIFMNGSDKAGSVIEDNLISGHRIGGYGGAVAINAVKGVAISKNDIKDNRSSGYGGGLFVNNSSADVLKNDFEGNETADENSGGGGVAILATDSSNRVVVSGNDFKGNLADYGSAALLSTYYDTGIVFVKNDAHGRSPGPLVYCDGTSVNIPKSNHLNNIRGPELGGSCVR